jgi:hypothetical protein
VKAVLLDDVDGLAREARKMSPDRPIEMPSGAYSD